MIFLPETKKKGTKNLFTDWRDDNTRIYLQETRKKNKDVFSRVHVQNFAEASSYFDWI
jgi:hypothetical protein